MHQGKISSKIISKINARQNADETFLIRLLLERKPGILDICVAQPICISRKVLKTFIQFILFQARPDNDFADRQMPPAPYLDAVFKINRNAFFTTSVYHCAKSSSIDVIASTNFFSAIFSSFSHYKSAYPDF